MSAPDNRGIAESIIASGLAALPIAWHGVISGGEVLDDGKVRVTITLDEYRSVRMGDRVTVQLQEKQVGEYDFSTDMFENKTVAETVAADLNAQAPAGIPSPSLDELAEQQGINPVRTPADIPTLEIDEPDMPPAQEMIQRECRDIEAVLLDKNKAYGNSALDPVRIFSTADPIEQIRVRIDDKLSRIKRGQALGEDVTRDLVGYLILLRVAEKMKGSNCQ